jgi:predicted amidophosphoribosyltransferase
MSNPDVIRPVKHVFYMPSAETMLRLRVESATRKQEGSKWGVLADVECEVCFSKLRRYEGPIGGIICDACGKPSNPHGPGRGLKARVPVNATIYVKH